MRHEVWIADNNIILIRGNKGQGGTSNAINFEILKVEWTKVDHILSAPFDAEVFCIGILASNGISI